MTIHPYAKTAAARMLERGLRAAATERRISLREIGIGVRPLAMWLSTTG
jgi:hypothetical protein